jgi:multiple sugar transport system ATP-binding protein
MAAIDFYEVSKTFANGTRAVDRLDLSIRDGEFLVLVGPSGSGKTTALRMTAGLEEVTSGEIRIGDRVVNDIAPKSRDIAMVFQNYALYPHMTVRDNMSFSLRLRHEKKEKIRTRVGDTGRMLDVAKLLERKPAQLSGGQRQRVAMGRAIVREPRAFLMDEPLSNLDAKLRVEMRAYISMLHQTLKTTTLYVTHDQTEAMTMGDRVAVMRSGRLEQVDSPQVLYQRPDNLFVASFIGSPAMNLVLARIESADGSVFAHLGDTRVRIPDVVLHERPALGRRIGQDVVVGIRPEDFEDATVVSNGNGTRLDVEVSLAEPIGPQVIVHFRLDARPVVGRRAVLEARDDADEELPDLAGADGEPGAGAHLVASLSSRTTAETGGRIELTIDAARLHFFDPTTELAI